MKKISDDVTQGVSKSAARAMLRAVGLKDEDFNKFQVGIVSAGNEVTPCNLTGPELSEHAKKGVNGPDSAGLIFSTIAVSDGISMGHEGMRASLVSREVIADSVELVMHAERFDGMVTIAGCDKSLPGMLMAAGRINRPAIFLYGGSSMPGKYKDKDIVIFGGGDSALDWSVELANKAKSIKLVHRRDDFRGAEHTENKMRNFVASGEIELKIPFVIKSIVGGKSFEGVEIMNFETKETEVINCDEALFFFGLSKQLGPINDWEIDLNERKVQVDTEKFETNQKGIFAVGDINTYPGKLDLILCGFHETTLAVQEAFKRINPGERVPFGYTTSNKGLQEKLKVSGS